MSKHDLAERVLRVQRGIRYRQKILDFIDNLDIEDDTHPLGILMYLEVQITELQNSIKTMIDKEDE